MSIAIIIPYKDRKAYLDILLCELTSYLACNSTEYDMPTGIYVAEPTDDDIFSVAIARNMGALAAIADGFDFLVFNDVDMVPHARICYGPPPSAPTRNVGCFGAVGNSRVWAGDFLAANGFDPTFKGWGYEDSEFIVRLSLDKGTIHWPNLDEARGARFYNLDYHVDAIEMEAFSRRHFGRDPGGPSFICWPHFLIKPSRDRWCYNEVVRSNTVRERAFLAMSPDAKRVHMRRFGVSAMRFKARCRRDGMVTRICYDSREVFPQTQD